MRLSYQLSVPPMCVCACWWTQAYPHQLILRDPLNPGVARDAGRCGCTHDGTVHTWGLAGASGIIWCMCPANERRRYNVTLSLIGRVHTQNEPWGLCITAYIEIGVGFMEGFNSMRLSNANMHQYNIPTLLQIMACRLFGAKPLTEPMLPYCQIDPKEHISLKFC